MSTTHGPSPRHARRIPRRRRIATALCVPTALAALAATPSAISLVRTAEPALAAPVRSSAQIAAAYGPSTPVPLTGPGSAWRTSVRSAPVNHDSSTMVSDLVRQVAHGPANTAAFNVWQYNAPIVWANRTTPRYDVRFTDCQHKGHTPKGLTGKGGVFTAVPIPSYASAAPGRDAHLTVWEPDTDQVWDFWHMQKTSAGWQACWGGRIDKLSKSAGYFPNGFGASASGALVAAGAITVRDVRAGHIDHALSLAIRDYAGWKNWSFPAQRSDGSASSGSRILMGTRFRLPASVDINRLGLTPIGKMIARAAQEYGFIVTDKSGVVAVTAQSGATMAVQNHSADPWSALLGSTKSYQVMANFPWNRLQALPKDYGKH